MNNQPTLLMKPYYQDNAVTIYHGDCREILPQLEPVDLVLTDPPYGNGEIMQGGTWGAAQKYTDLRRWDRAPDFIELVIRQGKTAMVWGGNYFMLPPSRCWLAWDKLNAVPTMADVELCWTNLNQPSKTILLACRRSHVGTSHGKTR